MEERGFGDDGNFQGSFDTEQASCLPIEDQLSEDLNGKVEDGCADTLKIPMSELVCPCGPVCKSFPRSDFAPDSQSTIDVDPNEKCYCNVTENREGKDNLSLFSHDITVCDHFYQSDCNLPNTMSEEKDENYFERSDCFHHDLSDDESQTGGTFQEIAPGDVDKTGRNIAVPFNQMASNPYLGGRKLNELDDDTILHIANALEPRSIMYGLSVSCRRFKNMFGNKAYWKTRITSKWNKPFPAVHAPDDFAWDEACIAGEDCQRVWGNPIENSHHFKFSNAIGEVDSLHLKRRNLLITGDRNRGLHVINLAKYKPESGESPTSSEMKSMIEYSNSTIHKGWIWSITSVNNRLLTASWDTKVRIFDMNTDMNTCTTFKLKSAVLCLYAEDNITAAGCYNGRVCLHDHRSDIVSFTILHKRPVLSVVGNESYIISGSEDKTVCIFDRRAGKVLKRIQQNDYSLSLSFRDNQLWCGSKTGQLHLYDANQGMFTHVGAYNIGDSSKITDILYTPGSIFTCIGETTLKILSPTRDPDVIWTFGGLKKQFAKVDYNCDVLVSSGAEDGFEAWVPKNWGKETYLL